MGGMVNQNTGVYHSSFADFLILILVCVKELFANVRIHALRVKNELP